MKRFSAICVTKNEDLAFAPSKMTQMKSTATAHITCDLAATRKWVCECESCREVRSLTGIDKVLAVRPLVREIEQIEEQLRDLPEGAERQGLRDRYLTRYDILAHAMAK